jgi:hypothetical protein
MQTIQWLTPHANIVTDESGWSPSLADASYACGWSPPNYPVPAIPLNVVMYSDVYIGCMYIERLNYGEDNPVIVYFYDSWNNSALSEAEIF